MTAAVQGCHLAAQARPDAQAVAGDAVVGLCLQRLAHGLVLQLVVLADPVGACCACEEAAAVLPDIPLTLHADCARYGTAARMPALAAYSLIVH